MVKVSVEAHSRLHMALIDLNGNLGRIDGGFGVALQDPSIRLEIEESSRASVEPYSKLLDNALRRAKKAFGYNDDVIVRLIDDYPEHIGLGHETQIMLAVGSAICKLKDLNISVPSIAWKMGRGGTSGVGVGIFETGGFVLDAGHGFGPNRVKNSFCSSSYSNAPPPPVICRCKFPEDWRVILLIPKIAKRIFGKFELDVFKQFCPIPANEVEKISRAVLFQLVPSVVENDLTSFGEALTIIRNTGFKRIEIDQQPPIVKEVMHTMEKCNVSALGLSSMGPAVFAVLSKEDDISEIVISLKNVQKKHSVECVVLETKGCNNGAFVQIANEIKLQSSESF